MLQVTCLLYTSPGAPLKKALLDAGIGKDIMGSYDNGVYQPIFSVISKNANMEPVSYTHLDVYKRQL